MARVYVNTGRGFKSLIGEEFTQLRVVEHLGSYKGTRFWKCQCSCGNTVEVATGLLKSGNVKSCGCRRGANSPRRVDMLDMVGGAFNNLTVLGIDLDRAYSYRVECVCGRHITVNRYDLLSGHSKSCGCIKPDKTKHGKIGTVAYSRWLAMKARCSNPNADNYKYYGGRGISICESWASFENFYADMGDPPEGTTLDRINSQGNYSPENCRWATVEEQARNRRSTVLFSFQGANYTLKELSEKLGISESTLSGRIYSGMSLAEALGLTERTSEVVRARKVGSLKYISEVHGKENDTNPE